MGQMRLLLLAISLDSANFFLSSSVFLFACILACLLLHLFIYLFIFLKFHMSVSLFASFICCF